jgi:hypothetical protein
MSRLFIAVASSIVLVAQFVAVAEAGVVGPYSYSGRPNSHCNAVTHVSYYDPRNTGQTIYDFGENSGDSMYYVDDEPLAGFEATSTSYETEQNGEHDCRGAPFVQATGFVVVTIDPPVGETRHIGAPECPRPPGNDRNPYCNETQTGVMGGFYVATADETQNFGRTGGVTVP